MKVELSDLEIPRGNPFQYGDNPMEHAAKNVVSFYLDYMASQVKEGKPILRFGDVKENLVREEYKRPIYRGIVGPTGRIFEYTEQLAKEHLEDLYAQGQYADVHNRIIEMNEECQIAEKRMMAAFYKQPSEKVS